MSAGTRYNPQEKGGLIRKGLAWLQRKFSANSCVKRVLGPGVGCGAVGVGEGDRCDIKQTRVGSQRCLDNPSAHLTFKPYLAAARWSECKLAWRVNGLHTPLHNMDTPLHNIWSRAAADQG